MTASEAKRNAQRGEGERSRLSRVGLFGGTFNPIHLGHLRAAEEVREALALERVIFVPSAEPPLKSGGAEHIAPARERLRWVERAIAGNPAFGVDALELERTGPSYTVDTLRAFGARLAPELPVFVIGSDAFAELAIWREPKALLALAHFAVLTRPSRVDGALSDWIPDELAVELALAPGGQEAHHRTAGSWLRRIPISALDISSTDVRRRLSEGRSVRYLLPEPVLEEVLQSGVYGPRQAR